MPITLSLSSYAAMPITLSLSSPICRTAIAYAAMPTPLPCMLYDARYCDSIYCYAISGTAI
eukprot:3115847-Rhodomonas_salina.1